MGNRGTRAANARKLLILLLVIALIIIEIVFNLLCDDSWLTYHLYLCLSRFVGAAVCIVFMIEFSFNEVLRPLGNKSLRALWAVFPAFIVAINNFPFVSFAFGDCSIKAPISEVLVYALFCVSVGAFEELAFRGCVFMALLKRRTNSRKDIFIAIFLSSAVFGAIHLVNLLTASPGAVILQIGYSALIGALCSLVLLATKNIWLCVLLHSAYNFLGNIVSELGTGQMWTVPQIIFTAVVALVVAVYSVWFFFKFPVDKAKELYQKD